MKSMSNLMYLPLALLFLAGCDDIGACSDTGGWWDSTREHCICKIYKKNGRWCLKRPGTETFDETGETARSITIQWTGSKRHVALNGQILEGTRFLADEHTVSVIAPSIGLAISIPDYPGQFSEEWRAGKCTFVRVDTSEQQKNTSVAFEGTCPDLQSRTSYLVNSSLGIVYFRISPEGNSPRISQFFNTLYSPKWLELKNKALTDFRRINEQADCYKVNLEAQGSHYVIIFSSEPAIEIDGDKITVTAGQGKCGNDAKYEFDENGKLIKRTFSR